MIQISIFLSLIFLFSLISKRMEKSVISGPMVFTLGGIVAFFVSPALSAYLPNMSMLNISNPAILIIGEITLAVILFNDAIRISFAKVIADNMLPARLLGIGMPLTILLGALAAAWLFRDLPIWEAAILATVLAPTDASLGAAVVESRLVPSGIRQALSVESGLNDGLSMPFLVLFIALAGFELHGAGQSWIVFTAQQIGLGVLVGLGIGGLGGSLLKQAGQHGWMVEETNPIAMLSLAILSWGIAGSVGGNGFIAAFVAGGALSLVDKGATRYTEDFKKSWGDLLVSLVFFYFGLVAAPWLQHLSSPLWLYALLSLTLVRMLPVAISLWGTGLRPASVLFLGWFGPRGLASIVLGLIYLEELTVISVNPIIVQAMIATVLLSILAHGISTNPVIKFYARKMADLKPDAPEYV